MGEAHPCFSAILFLWATAHHLKGLEMSENKETMQDTWQEFQKELNANTATKDATLCGACGEYMEISEEDAQGFHLPDKCSANDEIVIRSLFIEGRLWFDKINGNTYFSNRVWVNGKIAFVMPFEYGYELQFLHSALNELVKRGYTNTNTLWELRDEQGIDVYYSSTYGKKSEMFKETN